MGDIRKKQDDETTVWAISIPEITPYAIGKKRKFQEKIINMMKEQDGFIAVHPIYGATLCLYAEKNDAIRARNQFVHEGCPTGNGEAEVFVKTEMLEEIEKKKAERKERKK